MQKKAALALGIVVLMLPAVPAAADAGRWESSFRFAPNGAIVNTTLRAETSVDGRSIVTFNRTGFEGSCGRSKSRVRAVDGTWTRRTSSRALLSSQTLLTAGNHLAWIGGRCKSAAVDLRYAQQRNWDHPKTLKGEGYSRVQAAMNTSGTVVAARQVSVNVLIDTVTPRGKWTSQPTLVTDGAAKVDRVAITDDGEIIVVSHSGSSITMSTLRDGAWGNETIDAPATIVNIYTGANASGTVAVAVGVNGGWETYVAVRDQDGEISPMEFLVDDRDTNVDIGVLPSGDVVAAWDDEDGYELGRRAVESGVWSTEVLTRSYVLSARLDTNDDGTIVVANPQTLNVWTCSFTSACVPLGYPPTTDHGYFSAGPDGLVVGLSGKSTCDDWCDFYRLRGYSYQPS